MNQIYCNLRFLSFFHISSREYAFLYTDDDEKNRNDNWTWVSFLCFLKFVKARKFFYFAKQEACEVGNEKLFFRNLPWCIVNPRNQFSSRLQWHRRFLLPFFFPTLNEALKRYGRMTMIMKCDEKGFNQKWFVKATHEENVTR